MSGGTPTVGWRERAGPAREGRITEMIETRKANAGTGEEWLTKLSNAELRNLLKIRCEAPAE
jgi:hypothetical protein